MKCKIISICVFLFLISCSEDDTPNRELNSGALLKSKTFYASLTPTTIPMIIEYQYDSSDNLIKESCYTGEDQHLSSYYTYEYNSNNQLILENSFSQNRDNNDFRIITKSEYEHLGEQLISLTQYRLKANSEDEFEIFKIHTYKYDSGRLSEEIIDYEQTANQSKNTYEYDENGNLIKKSQQLYYSDDIFDYRWRYDTYNNKIEEKRYCNDEEIQKTTFEYTKMQLNKATTFINGSLLKEITYTYDDSGILIEEKKEIKNLLSSESSGLIIYEYY